MLYSRSLKIIFIIKILYYLIIPPCFYLLPVPGNHFQLSRSMSPTVLDSSYKQYNVVFPFLCLDYSHSIMSSRFNHIVANGRISFVFKTEYQYNCMYVLIHSSINGHSDCFHILAIINNKFHLLILYCLVIKIYEFSFLNCIPCDLNTSFSQFPVVFKLLLLQSFFSIFYI